MYKAVAVLCLLGLLTGAVFAQNDSDDVTVTINVAPINELNAGGDVTLNLTAVDGAGDYIPDTATNTLGLTHNYVANQDIEVWSEDNTNNPLIQPNNIHLTCELDAVYGNGPIDVFLMNNDIPSGAAVDLATNIPAGFYEWDLDWTVTANLHTPPVTKTGTYIYDVHFATVDN